MIKSNYVRTVSRAIDAQLVISMPYRCPFEVRDEKRHRYRCQATIVDAQWHPWISLAGRNNILINCVPTWLEDDVSVVHPCLEVQDALLSKPGKAWVKFEAG